MTSLDENTNLLIVCLTNELASKSNLEKARSVCGKTLQGGFIIIRYVFKDPKADENANKALRQVKSTLQNYPSTQIPVIEEELDF
jgi:hypothetical protein